MKKYSMAFLVYAGALCLVYYGSYRMAYDHSLKRNEENMSNVGEAVMADASDEPIIKADTEYIVELYNSRTKELTEVKKNIPAALLGLDRKETIEYAKAYSEEPGLEELEDGFKNMQLVAFSEDRIVFRKTYEPWERNYKYAIGIADGCIAVYYLDRKTVYEYTDIYPDDLPEELQIAIRKGECLMDVHSLYEFLENYSS